MTTQPTMQPMKAGLEDVIATTSTITRMIGDTGELHFRGYSIHDLAKRATFEEVVGLLLDGELPDRARLAVIQRDLAHARRLPGPVSDWVNTTARRFGKTIHPLDVLRTVASMLAFEDPDQADNSHDANRRKGIRLTAQLATALGQLTQVRAGQAPTEPDTDGSHAEYLFRVLLGRAPDEVEARTLDVALVLHAEHELNASTFAARVVTATESDLHAAITAAIAALKGPKHGGANEDVIEMLQEIRTPDRVEPYVKARLASKQRVPGFGHRVWRVVDPRAVELAELSRQMGEKTGDTSWYELSRLVAEIVQREKGLNANVDFYSATVYYKMGIPTDLYTSIFACSRIIGWTAHILEQWSNNRLIRPRADYTGPAPRAWKPVGER